MSLGTPLVVSDVGWFSELPDDVALKIPVGGQDEVDALAGALEHLGSDAGLRARMSASVRDYVAREHDLGRAAELYAAALEEAAGGDPGARAGARARSPRPPSTWGSTPDLLAPELAASALVSPDGRVPVGGLPQPGRGARLCRVWPVWLWLSSLYAVSVAIQLALGLRVVSPWIMVDELVYSDMARSFASTGHFLIRGAHANYGFVYPLLISPAYARVLSDERGLPRVRVIDALACARSFCRPTCSRDEC